MEKDYYTILGVHPKASSEDIREAYRKRAKELHPDHYGSNSSPFLEVQEAYDVLSDPAHRSSYDRNLKSAYQKSTNDSPRIETLKPRMQRAEPLRATDDLFELFNPAHRRSFRFRNPIIREVFGKTDNAFSRAQSFKVGPDHDLFLKIILTRDEARRGGEFRISVPEEIPCPTCLGRDMTPGYECLRCMGTGRVSETLPIVVEFAPGISDGYRKKISLRNYGIRDVSITLLFQIEGN